MENDRNLKYGYCGFVKPEFEPNHGWNKVNVQGTTLATFSTLFDVGNAGFTKTTIAGWTKN